MDYKDLESLFASDISKAIEECEKMICSTSKFASFQDFTSYHLKNAHFYYCPKQFSAKLIPQISIYCINCAKSNNLSLICLPCFLNGNHEGHNYFIFPGFMGNCECGDKFHLEYSGFCSNHQGSEDDDNIDNYLDESLRSILINVIFTSSIKAILSLQQTDTKKSEQISEFIIAFFKLGDGFRRLFVKSIIQNDLLDTLIFNDEGSPSHEILTIFSYLMHDQLFQRNLSKSVISFIYDKAIKKSSEIMVSQPNTISTNYNTWYQFVYTCFSDRFYRYNIEKNGWDWVTFSIELLNQYKKLLFYFKNNKYTTYPLVFNIIKTIHYATSIQPNEETQEFFDKIFTQVFNTGVNEINDTTIVETYKKFSVSTQIDSYLDFLKTFGDLMISFKTKKNLKFDKLFEELNKSIDITPLFMISKNSVGEDGGKNNENDKLITRFIIKKEEESNKSIYSKLKSKMKSLFHSYPSKYYMSFYNGASFFVCNPLYDSLTMLFRVDDLCRMKIAQFLCQEKYQNLRVKLGIITLKKILSIICFKMGLVQIKNFPIMILLDKIFIDKSEIINNMIPISVFQLLIGLQCIDKTRNKNIIDEFILKEFFSFELAREIGLFENINTKKKDLLVFTFLYVSLMFVIDRNLFNYEYKNVLEEQIIFALKKGIHSIDELHDILNTNIDNPKEYFTLFNEIIMKVARNSTNDDINENENHSNSDDDDYSANITLKNLSDMKISDDDYDYDNNNDNDNDDEKIKNKLEIKNIMINKKDNKKENQNSYIKQINFYLKDGIEYKAISAVNPIDDQKSYLNIEISKNPNKLLKIQNFESEETYFFNQNQENSNGLSIHLKQFLQTPTTLAILYDTLRSSLENSQLNDHLAMNILILISRFIKEEHDNLLNITTTLDSRIKIQYNSLPDLISKLKRSVFNFHSSGKDIDEKAFIENILNENNFISFLKIKFEPENQSPKSLIDILKEKGKLGQDVLNQITNNIHIDFLDEEENQIKTDEEQELNILQKNKAKKLKEDIINQFSNIRNHYHFSDSISESISMSSSGLFSPNKEVCSFCSGTKKNEILCYPLYIYRTKFPFIVDKPPFVSSEKVKDIAVYDNENDFDKNINIDDFIKNELGIKGKEVNEAKMEKMKICKNIVSNIFNQQQKEKEDLKIENEKMKRVTLGANFVVQYGICPHPFHRSCAKEEEFICPIDRSKKNGFLPHLDGISFNVIFKDLKTFELNSSCENDNSLSSNVVNSISSFIEKFKSFFDCLNENSLNVFVELIKSLSGLIETYEIRVRNLPDSLDSFKTKILARNLFLTVWYAYRIQKKPKFNENEIEINSRLTDFQKFIKLLIEFDDINNQDIAIEVKKMISSIINSILIQNQSNLKRKEKEICLFFRRVCLAEFFLLNINVNVEVEPDIIDWDEVFRAENLSKRYGFRFKSIDVSKNEEFEFRPFLFTKLPKDFLRLSEAPYKLPISEVLNASMFNMLDYNYLIKYYDDFDDTLEKGSENESNKNCTNKKDEANEDYTSNDNESNKNCANKENETNIKDNDNESNKNCTHKENEANEHVTSNDNESNKNCTNKENEANEHVTSNDNESYKNCTNKENETNINDNDIESNNCDDETKRFSRAVHVCDIDFLSFFLNFIGKLHYPSVFMFTGALSSQIFLVDQSQGAALETPYVDKTGCPDINHVRMQPLFLNEERYEKLIDQILSGDFSYKLNSVEKKEDLFSQDIESSDLF